MNKKMYIYFYPKSHDNHSYSFKPFVEYNIKGYCCINRDLKDKYFEKFQNDLINNFFNKMIDGSKEI